MLSDWFRNSRRERLLAEPFPAAWRGYIEKNIWQHAYMDGAKVDRVHAVTQVFVAETEWFGANGLTVTDEMKVTIAAQASMLTFGFDTPEYFDGVLSVIIYPREFWRPSPKRAFSWEYSGAQVNSGEAWYRGPIVLSWKDVLASSRAARRHGSNVTVHEFAHYIDSLDGEVNGVPPLPRDKIDRWSRITEAEYLRLVGRAERGEKAVLDYYGASNPAEFFAVATECFFEQPHEFARQHEELYGLFRDYFRQAPALWIPERNSARETDAARAHRNSSGKNSADKNGKALKSPAAADAVDEQLPTEQEIASLANQSAEGPYALGLEFLRHRQFRAAERIFTFVIEHDPRDAEAFYHRALARYELGDYWSALVDADAALQLDPESTPIYYCCRGAARMALGDRQGAQEDIEQTLDLDGHQPEPYYLRGMTRLGLGQFQKAIDDLTIAMDLRPHVAGWHYHRAIAYNGIGDYNRCERDTETALLLDPRIAERYAQRPSTNRPLLPPG